MRLSPTLRKGFVIPVLVIITSLSLASHALAGAPVLDAGNQPDLNNFYANVQATTADVYSNHAIYGKLQGTTPIDVYSFVPAKSGETQLSLYVRSDEVTSSTNPYLVLIDPTNNTQSQDLGVPLPNTDYHASVITQIDLTSPRIYTEPVIMETYDVAAQESVKLTGGKKYYIIVLDSDSTGKHITHYAIGFGTGKAWTAGDFFTSFGSWFRLRTDSYAGTTPFKFNVTATGYFLLLIGLFLMGGAWFLYHLFALLSNRSKTASYLFVKLQNFLPINIWVGLWLIAIGGYLSFVHASWAGIPFALTLVFIPLVVVLLIDTLALSPQVKKVEVKSKEAVLPLLLRKKLFIAFVFEFVLTVTMLVFLAMQIVAK